MEEVTENPDLSYPGSGLVNRFGFSGDHFNNV